MGYLVSARKWRPQRFEDLIGQEHVSRTLCNAIRSGRVAHAFLFTGVRGVGKTTAARILAKALNCDAGPTPTPCNECSGCQQVTGGSSVDVLEIDGASHTGVDDVRQIIENVQYQAAQSRFKIYIIDEVHMLSNSAFNALLKTLEEPPDHVKFIFATTDAHKLPATVQSRCQRYDFRRIPLRLVVERLRLIVASEEAQISDRALYVVAREGEGSMRDAQSLLDQILAFAEGDVSDEEVLSALGIADRQVIYDIADALMQRDSATALELVSELHERGHDLRRCLRDLVEHFRDLAVARATRGKLLPELPEEDARTMMDQARRADADWSARCFRIVRDADAEASRSPYPKLVMEMAIVQCGSLGEVLPYGALLERLDKLEAVIRSGTSGAGGVPAARASSGSPRPRDPRPDDRGAARPGAGEATRAPARPTQEARSAPELAAASVAKDRDWAGFRAFVEQHSPTIAVQLASCDGELRDKTMIVRAPKGFCRDYLADAEHKSELQDMLTSYAGAEVALLLETLAGVSTGRSGKAAAPLASMADLSEKVLKDPKVQAAMEVLGGEVAEVKSREKRKGR